MKNKLIALTVFLFFNLVSFGQGLYDLSTIQTIEINFTQSNWDYMLDTATQGADGYIMAASVTINGTVFDSVGVKYKGNSTYNANQVKNPIHIELDTYKNHNYEGYTDLKFSNIAKDPSCIREVLSYKILRQYMDAPQSNYANITINGNLIGLYSSSESISKKFVDKHFYSNNNTFIKCNPPGGAGPGGGSTPDLVYQGVDSSLYYDGYEMKSDYGWKDLIDLCDTIKNNSASIDKILDEDRALWMLAFNNTFVNLDSYIGGFTQNYYLYQDQNGLFNSVIWDLNECFGVFSQTGVGNLTSTTAKQQMSHLLHSNDANWPLIQKLLANPMYKRMYIAHMRTILSENIANNSYFTEGQTLQTLIGTSVQNDPNKFFTYTQFQNNLTSDVSSGMTNAPGITNLMNGRNTYLNSQAEFTATAPTISVVSVSNNTPALNSGIDISATVTDATNVLLGFRYAIDKPFQRIMMFDDGLHNDGAASDGVYAADLSVNSSFIQYYIYAENVDAGMFSPERAEHEFYSLTATFPTINVGDVVINELMAINSATVQDNTGDFDDWIELYNTTGDFIDLSNLYLSDDLLSPLKWEIPANTIIGPNGYVTIWADNDTTDSGLHANFKLSPSGESLILSYASGTVIDQVTFPAQSDGISYGRFQNGTGSFMVLAPTFAAENAMINALDELGKSTVSVFPNPTNHKLTVTSGEVSMQSIQLFDISGRLVMTQTLEGANSHELNLADLETGIYLLSVTSTKGERSTYRIVKN